MKLRRIAKLIAFSNIYSNSIFARFFWFVALICIHFAVKGITQSIYNERSIDIVLSTRCEAKCWDESQAEQFTCVRNCLTVEWIKPGTCSSNQSDDTPNLEKTCMNSCKNDTECTGILKCCQHSCGITCQTPTQLNTILELPSIPNNIIVDVQKKNNSAESITVSIHWSSQEKTKISQSQRTLYLIYERHHFGRQFLVKKMGDWIFRQQTNSKQAILENIFKPGRWYQFRIVAVNKYGTQGSSIASEPFFSFKLPRPPKAPQNLRVGATSWGNHKFHLQSSWTAPESDFPISKYKITWSRLKNYTLKNRQYTLPSNNTNFWLYDLEPNTKYFLQVQAVSKFGENKLNGEVSSTVFVTADHKHTNKSYNQNTTEIIRNVKFKQHIKNFTIDRLYWLYDQLLARISWYAVKKSQHYSITWSHYDCHDENKTWYIAKTDMTFFEVYDLVPDCNYKISVKTLWHQTLYESSKMLSTYNCTQNMTAIADIITECSLIT